MKKPLLITIILLFCFAKSYSQEFLFERAEQQSLKLLSSVQQDKIKKLKISHSYAGVRIIKIGDIERILKKGGGVQIDIPGVNMIYTGSNDIEYQPNGDFTWNGRIKNGSVTLYRSAGEVYGQVRKNNSIYDIQYLENGFAAVLTHSSSKSAAASCGISDHKTNAKPVDKPKDDISQNYLGRNGSNTPTVRVLVLYTQLAENTGRNMREVANLSIGHWNTLRSSSQVRPRLELANVLKLNDIRESDFTRESIPIFALANGLADNVEAQRLRNQWNADVVVILTNFLTVVRANGSVAEVGPSKERAYAAVQVNDAAGNDFVFVHEMGHIFGARHETPADNTPGDAHGSRWRNRRFPRADQRRRSVMHQPYSEDVFGRKPYIRVLHFSNPSVKNVTKSTGAVGARNNARVINVNGNIVCGFRSDPPVVSISGSPGLASNGQKINLSASVTSGTAPFTYNWRVNSGGGFYTASRTSTLKINMPTNQDLNVNLTVTDAQGRSGSGSTFIRNGRLGGGGGPSGGGDPVFIPRPTNEVIRETIAVKELTLFPNPTQESLNLSLPKDMTLTEIVVTDIKGATVMSPNVTEIEINNHLVTLDVSKFEPGVYFLKIADRNDSRSFRFIKY